MGGISFDVGGVFKKKIVAWGRAPIPSHPLYERPWCQSDSKSLSLNDSIDSLAVLKFLPIKELVSIWYMAVAVFLVTLAVCDKVKEENVMLTE